MIEIGPNLSEALGLVAVVAMVIGIYWIMFR